MICSLLIITLLYVCYAKYIRKDSVVKIGKYGVLIVLTNSMEPIIKERSLIIIKEETQYELNDIVTYVDSYGTLITHRILKIDEYTFMSRGDNNTVSDESTSINQIQGKVIFCSEILGVFVLYYLKFVIIICLFIWGILYWKVQFTKEEKNEEKEG